MTPFPCFVGNVHNGQARRRLVAARVSLVQQLTELNLLGFCSGDVKADGKREDILLRQAGLSDLQAAAGPSQVIHAEPRVLSVPPSTARSAMRMTTFSPIFVRSLLRHKAMIEDEGRLRHMH